MLTEDGKHLYVSYDEYHNLIEKLAIRVLQSGWEFDTILCLARGGMRPGDILSRVFDVPLAIMSTSSYRAEAGTVQGHLDIAHYITTGIVRWQRTQHRWNWSDVRQWLTLHSGRWVPIHAGEVELFNPTRVAIRRYRYRGAAIPSPFGSLSTNPTTETVESPVR